MIGEEIHHVQNHKIMKTKFSKQFILENCGCYSQEQVLELYSKLNTLHILRILVIESSPQLSIQKTV